MPKPYSMDLRERALARSDVGESNRSIARALDVAPSTVSKWLRRRRETGSVAPGQMGGHCPAKISGAHADWLRSRIRGEAFTLRGLVRELSERGLDVDYRTVWTFVHRARLSYKKNTAGGGTGPA